MLHVKFETVGAIVLWKKKFEYLFLSVDGPCMMHDAQRTITPLNNRRVISN